jgi:hypothetical protein
MLGNTAKAEWTVLGETVVGVNYVDLATINKKGSFAKMWMLGDLKAKNIMQGKQYNSIVVQMEFDCEEKNNRKLSVNFFSNNMGSGELIFKNDMVSAWSPIPPQSGYDTMLDLACTQ